MLNILAPILAAVYSFSATATGVDKDTPLEFFFVGKNSDRAYEAMFVLDEPIDEFCRNLEKAGFPRGKPINSENCVLWPTGCEVVLDPPIGKFVKSVLPEGLTMPSVIYTGGSREADGKCTAGENMPGAVFALYDCPQSALQFNGSFEQSVAYGWHTALETVKKGTKVQFNISWDEKTVCQTAKLEFKPGNYAEVLKKLKELSQKGEVDALISFSGELTAKEAVAAANALQIIDSPRVKINGRTDGGLFYRAFLPLVKWQDRKERLTQPFELSLIGDSETIFFIDEDWSVEGNDPKLTEKKIEYSDLAKYPQTDTCFITVGMNEKLSRVYGAMARFKKSNVKNWYVFLKE
jgi:hypothetical protein